MLVLALDTTTRGGSCALVDDAVVVREAAGDAVRPHGARLPGELMALLDAARVPLDAVDLYAVATGPGSFTGLRVGIAAMQGLAFAATKPLIGISTLDALAHMGAAPSSERAEGDAARPPIGRIATWVDAWRGEVYAALYEDGREVSPPTVGHPGVLLAGYGDAPIVFVGDGAATYADLIRATSPAFRVADPALPLLAATVARLALGQAREGHRPPPHAIRPLYVRRPDAELARDARVER